MPRKKQVTPKRKKASPVPTNTRVRKGKSKNKTNGDVTKQRIRGNLLLKYRAVSAEWNEARVLCLRTTEELTEEKKKPVHAPLVKLLNEQSKSITHLKNKARELKLVQEAIAEKLGVTDLKGFLGGHTIDTETGEVKPALLVPEQNEQADRRA